MPSQAIEKEELEIISGTEWPWPVKQFVFIVGVGRSGTSALGKILGSCKNTYYLYEPAIFKYMIALLNLTRGSEEVVRAILFEDYLLPIVQGRYVNTSPLTYKNTGDESCIFNYWAGKDIQFRRDNLNRRKDAISYLKVNPPTVIIKTLESATAIPYLMQFFPDAILVPAIRNGNDVIGSSKRRDWYTDEWLASIVDYTYRHRNCKIPWHIPEAYWNGWPEWNQETRIAAVWSDQNGQLPENNAVRYESLTMDAEAVIEDLGLIKTDLTEKHIEAVNRRDSRPYQDVRDQLAEPVRTDFLEAMEELGYAV